MFKAAENNPYNFSWEYDNSKTPDYDLEKSNNLTTLVNRSRQLIKDNAVVFGLQQAWITSMVGEGPEIYFNGKKKTTNSRLNEILNNFLDCADVTGLKSFHDILIDIASCKFSDGDMLISLPQVNVNGRLTTRVEIIESHRIRTPLNKKTEIFSNLVRNGVQYNKDGSVEGFWVVNADKVDKGIVDDKDYTFYPVYREYDGYKRKVTILCRIISGRRATSSRQYPLTVPIMELVKYHDDFQQAVLIGARVAACFAAFIEASDPSVARKTLTTNTQTGATNEVNGQPISTLKPGLITALKKGDKITFSSPNKPSDNTDDLTLRMYKTFSMAIRMPYIVAFLDTEEVSYSSWRGAVVEWSKSIKTEHKDFNRIINWIVETVIAESYVNGELKDFDINNQALKIRWPSLGILDKEKDNRANKLSNELGTISKRDICDENGEDYDEILKEREQEALDEVELQAEVLKKKKELEEKFGIEFPVEKGTNSNSDEGAEGEESTPKQKERRKQDGNW